MKFSTSAVLCVVATAMAADQATAFAPPQPTAFAARTLTTSLASTTEEEIEIKKKASKKEDRLRMMKSEQFYRRGFKEVRDKVEDTMQGQFKSELVDELKSSNYVIDKDGVKVYLAKVRKKKE